MFDIVNVDSSLSEDVEQLGTKKKFWFRDDNSRRTLFKAEERGTGEDWAEKICCELCELLRLPHVHYELAYDVKAKVPGVICENCAPPPQLLILGNELLFQQDSSYPQGKYKLKEHTIDVIIGVLKQLQIPPSPWSDNLPEGIASAADLFAGYLMLDAWVANQDRHHENWGALKINGVLYLAPTYDHGASLARNLSDEKRNVRLTTNDVNQQIPTFVRKARSAIYETPTDPKPLKTHDLFSQFARHCPTAAEIWIDRLTEIEDNQVEQIITQIPPKRMTKITRQFTNKLLQCNREYLLGMKQEL